jgi:hypothetical protein
VVLYWHFIGIIELDDWRDACDQFWSNALPALAIAWPRVERSFATNANTTEAIHAARVRCSDPLTIGPGGNYKREEYRDETLQFDAPVFFGSNRLACDT